MNDRDDLDPLCSLQVLTVMARIFLGNALPTDLDARPSSPIFGDSRRFEEAILLHHANGL